MQDISKMSYKEEIINAAFIDLPWEKFQGCNILITGGTGLIGSCLVNVLMSRPNKSYQIYALGRNENRARAVFQDYLKDPSFHFICHNIIEPLKECIEFSYIIHAASNASPNFFSTNPVEIIKSNIYGLCNLFDYGKGHGLKRLLFISTGEVYGECEEAILTEEKSGYVDCLSPRSCYPSSKRAAETLCVSYGSEYGIDTVIARPCHIYGPCFTESDNRVYAQFIRNILKGEDIVLKSKGEQMRSWCYVIDCVTAVLYILLKGENGKAYNISDNSSILSIKELAEMIAMIDNKKVVYQIPDINERSVFNPIKKSIFSSAKLEALGWTASGNMKDKLLQIIEERKSLSL